MKELKEFTVERLEELSNANIICKVEWDERVALAKIALAAKQAKPVGYFRKMPNSTYHPLSKSTAVMDMVPLFTTPPLNHTEQDGWVKCSERMPEVGVEVLMRISCNKHFNIESGQYKGDGIWVGAWCDIYGKTGSSYQIAHWMPLPASPKPEK